MLTADDGFPQMKMQTAEEQAAAWVPGIEAPVQAFGLMAAPMSVAPAAVRRVLAVTDQYLNGGGGPIRSWYNRNVENLGDWGWAYCAATVSMGIHVGGAGALMRARAYCPYMVNDARGRANGSEWVNGTAGIQPGDVVQYSWNRNGVADHTGIVKQVNGGSFLVREGNTSGGLVKDVWRDSTYIMGYARLNWAALGESTSGTGTTTSGKTLEQLAIEVKNGLWGNGDERKRRLGAQYDAVQAIINGGTPAASSGPRILRRGSTGADVRALQAALNSTFPLYSKLTVDGDFGPATERVVREFQRRAGVGIDGEVGPSTRAAMSRNGVRVNF